MHGEPAPVEAMLCDLSRQGHTHEAKHIAGNATAPKHQTSGHMHAHRRTIKRMSVDQWRSEATSLNGQNRGALQQLQNQHANL